MKRFVLASVLAGCTHVPLSASIYHTSASGRAISSSRVSGPSSGDRSLVFTGLITLSAGYVATVGGGQFARRVLFDQQARTVGGDTTVDRLWVPVLGAWSGLLFNETTVRPNCEMIGTTPNCSFVTLSSALIAVGAAAQTTGLVLTVVGLVRLGPKGGPGQRLVLMPQASGLAIAGQF